MSESNSKRGIQGAWLLHHDQKLAAVNSREFQNIALAGRGGRLLSAVSQETETTVSTERVEALALANGIRKYEVPGLLGELAKLGLVDATPTGVAVLGVSQTRLLSHTADLFTAQNPEGIELAAIELADIASDSPVRHTDCADSLSDAFRLSKADVEDLFSLSAQIGFVDWEQAGNDRLYFNGNLFRRESAEKTLRVLDGLSPDERMRLQAADEIIGRTGCQSVERMQQVLGPVLWSKLHQISYFDVSAVTNEYGSTPFVTKPAALAKFVPGGLADTLNEAKALASSLTYGILKSSASRGRIREPSVLLDVFINRGYVEGRAAALKQDYNFLEERGVVQVSETPAGNRLSLRKIEVGRMARELILRGDASQAAAHFNAGPSQTGFAGPEATRQAERRRDIPESRSGAARALDTLRKTR